MSNGNAAAALLATVAILTGMAHLHGSPGRRHASAHHWSSPERVELGDARIPVRSVRVRGWRPGSERARRWRQGLERDRSVPEFRDTTFTGKAAAEPEIIVGYVDPNRGPAAFHRLARVVEGDRVKVVRKDHSVAWFTVDSVHRVARPPVVHRPMDGRPELRLVSWRGPEKRRGSMVVAHLDRAAASPQRSDPSTD